MTVRRGKNEKIAGIPVDLHDVTGTLILRTHMGEGELPNGSTFLIALANNGDIIMNVEDKQYALRIQPAINAAMHIHVQREEQGDEWLTSIH